MTYPQVLLSGKLGSKSFVNGIFFFEEKKKE